MIVLVIGFSFALVGSVIYDFETQYPEVDVNTTWENTYDYTSEINKTVDDIKVKFDIIGSEETGWFSKIAAGITAIPKAIIAVPTVLFQTAKYALIILSDISSIIGLPDFVLPFATVAFIVVLLFGLVSFWHRSKI